MLGRAVIIGYIAGAALLIIANQLNLFWNRFGERSEVLFPYFSLFDRLDEANLHQFLGLEQLLDILFAKTMKSSRRLRSFSFWQR